MQANQKLSQNVKHGCGNLLSENLPYSAPPMPVEHVYSCAQGNTLNHGRQNSDKHVHQRNACQGYLEVI